MRLVRMRHRCGISLSGQTGLSVGYSTSWIRRLARAITSLFFTADHGVAPLPEVMQQRKMPGGRIPEGAVLNAVQGALATRYGAGDWVVGKSGPAPYLNHKLIREKKLDLEEVQNTAAEGVTRTSSYLPRVHARSSLRRGASLEDMVDRRVRAGFHISAGFTICLSCRSHTGCSRHPGLPTAHPITTMPTYRSCSLARESIRPIQHADCGERHRDYPCDHA